MDSSELDNEIRERESRLMNGDNNPYAKAMGDSSKSIAYADRNMMPEIDETAFIRQYLWIFFDDSNEEALAVGRSDWVENVARSNSQPVNIVSNGETVCVAPPIVPTRYVETDLSSLTEAGKTRLLESRNSAPLAIANFRNATKNRNKLTVSKEYIELVNDFIRRYNPSLLDGDATSEEKSKSYDVSCAFDD